MKTIILVKQAEKPLRCFVSITAACKRLKLKQKPQTIRQAMSDARTNVYTTGDIELIKLEIER